MLTIHLSIVLFLPFAAGLLQAFLPSRIGRWVALAGAVGVLAYAVVMVIDVPTGSSGLHYVTDDHWISELGIRYSLGVDGLNLYLIALTALLWAASTLWAAVRVDERQKLFLFHLALGETAVLGAFMAQDLALFVVFFDLMLVPFYFLIGGWGQGDRVKATTKFVIYTLVGSLLMLAGAVALGVLSTPEGGNISFSLATLAQHPVGTGTQEWIFLLFALAFLVKAPAFPFHGWVVDTYRSTPIPVLVLLSAVLSKVGVYAFLKIVLPLMPAAAHHFQTLLIVIAVFSIFYGSFLAFSQDEPRLVVAYSSIAQLGFITLGIFTLDNQGAQGALMQMVNHGLVTAALFFVIAVVTVRAGGSTSMSEMGGVAFRAPVLAALFLVATLANLAMPGSPNFVGEILILFGAFGSKLVFGLVASAGVVLASVYMIRVFQRTMHNRVGPKVESSDVGGLEFAVIAPILVVIVALGLYPQAILDNTKASTSGQIRAAAPGGAIPVAKKPAAAAPIDPTGGAQAVPQGQDVPQGAGAPQGGGQQLTPEQIQQLQQQIQQSPRSPPPTHRTSTGRALRPCSRRWADPSSCSWQHCSRSARRSANSCRHSRPPRSWWRSSSRSPTGTRATASRSSPAPSRSTRSRC
jgi:NADH-quinone oxidoreductase subunit M